MDMRAHALTICLLLAMLGGLACIPMTGAQTVHNILDHGATPDGKTLCTEAIQKAIDAAGDGGGGTVRFPKGAYLSGALRLRSGVTLQLDFDATLLGSRNREDYYGTQFNEQGEPVEGTRVFRHLIHGEGLHDIAIRGPGGINGNGDAFRDKSKPRPKCIYLADCRSVHVEDVVMQAAGCWMQHYRFCEGVTIRGIEVFNHAAFNNDGLNIDSCRDVTITDCRIDSDDDGIVLKSLSDQPCRRVRISGCSVSSHCNGIKMGTESGGGFIDITVSGCDVSSPESSKKIYGSQRGLAGIALEIVDGGTLENVTVTDVVIHGVSVPIFLRLGNRARPYVKGAKPGIGTFRNVRLANITARAVSKVGCSITGLPAHPIEDVELRNVVLESDGGGTREEASRAIPEREGSYPESTMFGALPAYGFYCRHVRGLRLVDLCLSTHEPDLRHALVLDDVQDAVVDGLDAQYWMDPSSVGAPLVRLTNVQGAIFRRCSPGSWVDTLLRLEGKATQRVLLEKSDLTHVTEVAEFASGVAKTALSVKRTQ